MDGPPAPNSGGAERTPEAAPLQIWLPQNWGPGAIRYGSHTSGVRPLCAQEFPVSQEEPLLLEDVSDDLVAVFFRQKWGAEEAQADQVGARGTLGRHAAVSRPDALASCSWPRP